MTALGCANRLGEDVELLKECHRQGDVFYPLLCSLLERYLAGIQRPFSGKPIALLSWHMATSILRCFPEEDTNRPVLLAVYAPTMKCAVLLTFHPAGRRISTLAWVSGRQGCQGNPNLYQVCKVFWRQLPICLVHQSVAKAVRHG